MAEKRQTLLAHLASWFGPSTENLAVEALAHVLSVSEPARRALADLLSEGGAAVGPIALVRSQATGEDGARPDLACLDEQKRERVLIEAKFEAGLTQNQPLGYLKRLSGNAPSTLLFVVPVARTESLWSELRQRVAQSTSGITLESFQKTSAIRSASAGDARRLMLTSWKVLLRRLASAADADGDSQTAAEIEQLRGLATMEERDLFLPLTPEELTPEFPRRMLGMHRLVDDAIDRAVGAGWASTRGLAATPQRWGYGRYVRLSNVVAWFGVDFVDWAENRSTPLWLWFTTRTAEEVGPLLDPLRKQDPSELFEWDDGLTVPIEPPVGVEYEHVLDAVVERLHGIARLLADG